VDANVHEVVVGWRATARIKADKSGYAYALEETSGDFGPVGSAREPQACDRVTVRRRRASGTCAFGTGDAATGWEELCRLALANTRRCLETLRADPRSGANRDRQHGCAATLPPIGTMGVI